MNIHRCRFVDYTPHTITAVTFNEQSAVGVAAPASLRLAVGRANGDIEIWSPRWSWIHETTLKGGKGRVIEGLAWSRGSRLFSIGGSTSITEWDLATGLPLVNHDCHSGVIWSIAASPDGSQLAVGCDNGTVVLLDVSAGVPGVIEHGRILQRHTTRIMCLAWKGENEVVGGCSDGRIRVWSTQASLHGRIVSTMRVDKSRREDTMVWTVMVLPKTQQIVSGDSTGSIKFWDGQSFSLLQTFQVHEADVLCLTSDSTGTTVFSAGVDRKIASYQLVKTGASNKLKRWTNISSRLLHGNDIRAMASFEARGSSFLVSGGVETTLLVTSVADFTDGMFRKIPITRHQPCVQVVPEPRLLVMWSDNTVKIWKIDEYIEAEDESTEVKGKRLVAKISVNSEGNVTHAAVSTDGGLLAVSTLTETKLFALEPSADGSRLQVAKMEEESSKLANVGARIAVFTPSSSTLVLVTPDSEIVLFDLAKRQTTDIESPELPPSATSSIPSYFSISRAEVSLDSRFLATTRPSGHLDLYDLVKKVHLSSLARLSTPPTALMFTNRGTLVVATTEIKIVEFDVSSRSLSAWSRRNSDLLPRELVNLVDKCCGIFCEPSQPERIWAWGANWVAFLDTSVNLEAHRVSKRKMDRLGLTDSFDDDDVLTAEELRSQVHPVDEQQQGEQTKVPFWITLKYRPMLLAGSVGAGELVVVERPLFDLPLPAAFWSNHKIKV